MRLPDFSSAAEFQQLRNRMGAVNTVDLGAENWTPLPPRGIDIEDINDVVPMSDGTLVYNGHRVLVYIRDQYLNQDGSPRGYRYHVAECSTLIQMRRQKRFGRYVATNRRDGRFVVNFFMFGENEALSREEEAELGICRNCLKELDWEGYKSRIKGQSQREAVWERFSPSRFFELYSSQVAQIPEHNENTAPLNIYTADWKAISEEARKRADWTCDQCGANLEDHRHLLHVHHKDANRGNNKSTNLRVLCIGCHAKAPEHRHMVHSPGYLEYQELKRAGVVRVPITVA